MAAGMPEKRMPRFTERRLPEKGGVEKRRASFGLSRACSAGPVAACRVFATATFTFTDSSMATIETRAVPKLNERSACLLPSAFLLSRTLLRRNDVEREIYRQAAKSVSKLRQAFETQIVHGAHIQILCHLCQQKMCEKSHRSIHV
jgi:hypothetical protein